jgi:hypothetical protein
MARYTAKTPLTSALAQRSVPFLRACTCSVSNSVDVEEFRYATLKLHGIPLTATVSIAGPALIPGIKNGGLDHPSNPIPGYWIQLVFVGIGIVSQSQSNTHRLWPMYLLGIGSKQAPIPGIGIRLLYEISALQ